MATGSKTTPAPLVLRFASSTTVLKDKQDGGEKGKGKEKRKRQRAEPVNVTQETTPFYENAKKKVKTHNERSPPQQTQPQQQQPQQQQPLNREAVENYFRNAVQTLVNQEVAKISQDLQFMNAPSPMNNVPYPITNEEYANAETNFSSCMASLRNLITNQTTCSHPNDIAAFINLCGMLETHYHSKQERQYPETPGFHTDSDIMSYCQKVTDVFGDQFDLRMGEGHSTLSASWHPGESSHTDGTGVDNNFNDLPFSTSILGGDTSTLSQMWG